MGLSVRARTIRNGGSTSVCNGMAIRCTMCAANPGIGNEEILPLLCEQLVFCCNNNLANFFVPIWKYLMIPSRLNWTF